MPDSRLLDLNNLVARQGKTNLAKDIAANLRLIDERHGIERDHKLNDVLELDALVKTSDEKTKLAWQSLLANRYMAFADLEQNKGMRGKYDAYLALRKTFLKSMTLSDSKKASFKAALKNADAYLLSRCENQSLHALDGTFLKRLLGLGSDLKNIITHAFSRFVSPPQDSFKKMAELGLHAPVPSETNVNALPQLVFKPELKHDLEPTLDLKVSQPVYIEDKSDINSDAAIAKAQQEFDDMDSALDLQEWEDRQSAIRLQQEFDQELQDEALALRLTMSPNTFNAEALAEKKRERMREKAELIEESEEMAEEEALQLSLLLESNEWMLGSFGLFAIASSLEISCTFVAIQTFGLVSETAVFQQAQSSMSMSIFMHQQAMFFATPRPSPYDNRRALNPLQEEERPGLFGMQTF